MTTEAIAYPPGWRVAAALLLVVSRGSLIAIAAIVLVPELWPSARLDNPLRLLRAFAWFSLAPGATAWLVARLCTVRIVVRPGMLMIERHGGRIEVPAEVVDRVVPWRIPLPRGGVGLRLRSGRRLEPGLAVPDPIALADALANAGAPAPADDVARSPCAAWTRSRRWSARGFDRPVLRFVAFALVPALPLFRLHQWIAYGGTFGEYYMFGLQAYLLAFAVYWATAIVHLVLYAAVLRVALEPVVATTAWLAPAATPKVRHAIETAHRVLYVGGIAAFLLRLWVGS